MAAGKGTRLAPYTDNLPKALYKIKGKPEIEYVLDSLLNPQHGGLFDRITFCTGSNEIVLIDHIRSYISRRHPGVSCSFSTGGPRGWNSDLMAAYELLNDTFFVVNGDTYTDFDYDGMLWYHTMINRGGRDLGITMAVRDKEPHNYYIDKNDVILSGKVPNTKDAGVYIFDKQMLPSLPLDGDSIDLSYHIAKSVVQGFMIDKFYDLGSFEGIEKFDAEVIGGINHLYN